MPRNDKSYPWPAFTHDELSMIASHLAGGGILCCDEGADARKTITSNRSRRERLADEAYQRFECTTKSSAWQEKTTANMGADYVRKRIAEETAYCLEKFLDTV